MNKNRVCNLKLAKKLEELGESQNSLWYWVRHIKSGTNKNIWSIFQKDKDDKVNRHIAAPTATELIERLPASVIGKVNSILGEHRLIIYKHDNSYQVCYGDYCDRWNKVLANALAEMKIFLLENKLIKEE